jgi:hypothetical protein
MIDAERLAGLRQIARRDDAWKILVPSDVRELIADLEQMTLMRDMLIAQLQSHGIDPVVHVEPKPQ